MFHDSQRKNNFQNVNSIQKSQNAGRNGIYLEDNRPQSIIQRQLNEKQNNAIPIQKKNTTGLTNQLKSGIENLSGYSMDDVKVHYNSAKPAQLQAHAYAQGNQIHIAPGQEKHVPHEAWHVVQQKQGRVVSTKQLKGKVAINDDAGLEKEADVMGQKAMHVNASNTSSSLNTGQLSKGAIQRQVIIGHAPAILSRSGDAIIPDHEPISTNGKESWVTDRYARFYNSVAQFEAHSGGQPVDVGLARKYGRWYSIEQLARGIFFVLGENHGAFGYRELMKESNQHGKVLGEGGANKLKSADRDNPLQANTDTLALKTGKGQSREFMMENLAAKVIYSLKAYRSVCEKESPAAAGSSAAASSAAGPSAAAPPPIGAIKEPEAQWLEHYQSSAIADRGENNHSIPFYLNADRHEVYATYGSAAEDYSVAGAASKALIRLWHEINGMKTRSHKDEQTVWSDLRYLLEVFKPGKMIWGAIENKHFDSLNDVMLKWSHEEVQHISGGKDETDEFADVLVQQDKKGKRNQNPTLADIGFAQRDIAMYYSVLKAAEEGGYVMAGMGNRHAMHLVGPLRKAGISVITLEEFLTDKSVSALNLMKVPEAAEEKDPSGPLAGISGTAGHEAAAASSSSTVLAESETTSAGTATTAAGVHKETSVTSKMKTYLAGIGVLVVLGAAIGIEMLRKSGYFEEEQNQ